MHYLLAMPQNGNTATQAQYFLKKKKWEKCTWRYFVLFELKFNQKGSSSPVNSRKYDICELPQTHTREISPNLHCLYHTFPPILTDKS